MLFFSKQQQKKLKQKNMHIIIIIIVIFLDPSNLVLNAARESGTLFCRTGNITAAGHLEDSDKLCHLKGYDN